MASNYPKPESMLQQLEDSILKLYAKFLSSAGFIDFIDHTYGVKYSLSQITLITNQLLEDIRQWQQRRLPDQYTVVWIDAIHYKIRQDGKIFSEACMIRQGIQYRDGFFF